jgi:hypothetical protein
MANNALSKVCVSSVFEENETSEILCKCCEKLKLDLLEASCEFSSAGEIIKLLQEEINRS